MDYRLLMAIGFILVAFAVLLFIMALVEGSPIQKVFASITCHSDEELASDSTRHSGTKRSIHFYCRNSAGESRVVTEQYVLLMLGVCLVPFSAGMWLFGRGFNNRPALLAHIAASKEAASTSAGKVVEVSMMPMPRPSVTPGMLWPYSRCGFIRVSSSRNQTRRRRAACRAQFSSSNR